MQKAISVLLCFLLLASSANVTYAKHFCGGQEVLSVFTMGETFLTCNEKEDVDICDDKKQKNNPCCKNKYENVDIDENFANESIAIIVNVPFIKSFVSVFLLPSTIIAKRSINNYADYDPPPLDKDIPVLYQVFII